MPNEVLECISMMKCDKAPSVDGIPVEVFKTSKDAEDQLASLLSEIWERMIEKMSVRTMLMMHRNGSTENRKNYKP